MDHKFSYGEDIFTFYNSKTTREGHSISEVKQNFAMGEDGLVRLSGYADGSDRYLAYAPLGINDWMICYVASVTVAQQSYAFVEKYEMVFLGCFGILVCLLILYIVRKNRQKTEAILHSAQTDELTQVYNRKYAERFAENARANCSLTKHSRDGNKLAEQGNEILEYSWYKSGQNPPAGKDRVMNLFNY